MGKLWKEDEIKVLKENYSTSRYDYLQKLFTDRTLTSIKVKAKKLKLKRDKKTTFKLKSDNLKGNTYGKTNKGRKLNKEWRNKISKANKGKKGLLGEKNPMYGKPSPMRGKKMKPESIKKSIETRRKNWNELPDSIKKEKLNLKRKQMAERVEKMKKSTSKPELIVIDFLNILKINFEHQKRIGFYVCDFILQDLNKIIEVQGDYWHANPKKFNENELNYVQIKNVNRDKAKKTYLQNKGYDILYLWEDIIINENNKCKKLIYEYYNK